MQFSKCMLSLGRWGAPRCPANLLRQRRRRESCASAGGSHTSPCLLLPPARSESHWHLPAATSAGTLFTAVAHIFCGVVGAGVLGLPNAVSWLGWVAGPLCLTAFFAVALWSSIMLSKLYSVDGIEFARYHHAVRHILGQRCATRRRLQCGGAAKWALQAGGKPPC